MKRLSYWFAGVLFNVVALAEMLRLWWGHDDDEPPHGAVLA